jgi:hypothetical protein
VTKQIPLKIKTSFSEVKPAGQAAKYLNSGEIDVRSGMEISLGCVFAPLGAATNGASCQEVEKMIARSRTQFEIYMDLARSRCQGNSEPNSKTEVDLPSPEVTTPVVDEELEEEKYINFDDEEF